MKPEQTFKCTRCDDTGWVCEVHVLRSWKTCDCGAARTRCGRCYPSGAENSQRGPDGQQ
jgi:hypothetical protein